LTIYKQQNNGSTNISQRCPINKPLGNWVKTQRQQYKLLQDRKKSRLTDEHIKSLNKLDFEWSPGTGNTMPSTVWDVRLQELTTYKQQNNGSTNVPQRFPSNKPLGLWVKTQKQQYKLFQEDETSHMTDERIKSLNELGFEWNPGNKAKVAPFFGVPICLL
jgi:hypothetical protein